jgi:hypothetical protein
MSFRHIATGRVIYLVTAKGQLAADSSPHWERYSC